MPDPAGDEGIVIAGKNRHRNRMESRENINGATHDPLVHVQAVERVSSQEDQIDLTIASQLDHPLGGLETLFANRGGKIPHLARFEAQLPVGRVQ